MQRFVDGFIKTGRPEPDRYYEVYKENKLIGDEVRDLVIGKTQVLAGFAGLPLCVDLYRNTDGTIEKKRIFASE